MPLGHHYICPVSFRFFLSPHICFVSPNSIYITWAKRFVPSFTEQPTVILLDTNTETKLWCLRLNLSTETEAEYLSHPSCCCTLQQMIPNSISLASHRENLAHCHENQNLFFKCDGSGLQTLLWDLNVWCSDFWIFLFFFKHKRCR